MSVTPTSPTAGILSVWEGLVLSWMYNRCPECFSYYSQFWELQDGIPARSRCLRHESCHMTKTLPIWDFPSSLIAIDAEHQVLHLYHLDNIYRTVFVHYELFVDLIEKHVVPLSRIEPIMEDIGTSRKDESQIVRSAHSHARSRRLVENDHCLRSETGNIAHLQVLSIHYTASNCPLSFAPVGSNCNQ